MLKYPGWMDQIIETLKTGNGNFAVECVLEEDFKKQYGRTEFVLIIPVESIDEQV